MFRLADKFDLYDANSIPHTLRPELHSATQNLHASVDERGFALKSIGNRWVLKTPVLKDEFWPFHSLPLQNHEKIHCLCTDVSFVLYRIFRRYA